MKYSETGFRAIYKHFCVFPVTDTIRNAIADYPDAEKANCVLTYGYIDYEAGLSLRVLAAGKHTERCYRFFAQNPATSTIIRIRAVENEEFALNEDKSGTLKERYAVLLDQLKAYKVSDEIEETRKMDFLDSSRDPYYPDDVMVVLFKEGNRPEGCWTRITGLGEHWIMGRLLNEPDQNFGYHKGEEIAFFVNKDKDGKITCCSDMNPSAKITAEDLEDGSMLKKAVAAFNIERTQDHFIDIMELLRDSFVWIPCSAVYSEADQKRMQDLISQADGDPSKLVGMTFTNQDPVRMVPDILQSGDKFYFPVFSSDEEMGEYGNGFSRVQRHMLDALHMAMNNEKEVAGIVLNAFSEPFILDRQLFDMLEKMKSRL